jgi:tetratricopeptide (TPR) repeat protein
VRLLLAEHGIVPFLGRQQLLDDLQAWCDPTPGSLGVQVLTGKGGSGKTRLAAELCMRLRGVGWDAGFADPSTPNGQTQLGFERATLLVVDNADLQVQLSTAILTRLAAQPHRPPLRLLLLARFQGAWWEQLTTQTDGLAEDYATPPRTLEAGALTLEEREQHRDTAGAVFAAQLPGDHATVEVPTLTDPTFANPLLVHMSVLLSLLGQPVTNASGGSPRTRLLQRLLDRESKRWTNSLPGAGLTNLSVTVTIQAVTVATLTSPHIRAETVALLQAVPDLADADLERRGRIADWLHQLYPDQAGYVAPLRPDLLAEQHLADTPDLAELTVNAYQHTTSPPQVAKLLAELTRASRAYPAVQAALHQLLDYGLPGLFDQAVGAPTSPIPGVLTQALQIAPHPEAAAQLVGRLPQRSTALATLAATISEQAVQHYRILVEANPDAYLPDLALALSNLGARLWQVGRWEEALAPTREAVTIRRRLAKANPDAYLPDLAATLSNLGVVLSEVGRREEALAPAQEAVTIRRRLAEANPDAHLPHLAGALTNLGAFLSEVGRPEEALAIAQEAVTTYRRLAEANLDAHLPDLAMALNNLGKFLSEVGQRQQALTPAQEAVTTYRRLAEANPDAHLPDLAMSLNNLGAFLWQVGRREEALAPAQEAVTIRRQLAKANPDAHLPDLAGALNNLGKFLSDVGRNEDVAEVRQELASVRERMGDDDANSPS